MLLLHNPILLCQKIVGKFKAFKKQRKTIEEQRKKQINSVMNQIQRLAALTNKGIYKKIFDKRVD